MAKYIVQHRRGTMAQWAAHDTVIPEEGELVIEIDEENSLHKLKIGDGVHTYAELAYLQAGDEIVTQVLHQALPRVVTVTLDVDKWTEVTCETDPNLGYYGQTIELDNITENSRLDLQPNADMLAEFKSLDLVFVTENNGGVITVYSVGDMPLKSYTMQATVVETDVSIDSEKIVGIPVGTPTTKADWNQTDESKVDYIKNKPNVLKNLLDAESMCSLKQRNYIYDEYVEYFNPFMVQYLMSLGLDEATAAAQAPTYVQQTLANEFGITADTDLTNASSAPNGIALGICSKNYSPTGFAAGLRTVAGDSADPTNVIAATAIGIDTKSMGKASFAGGTEVEANANQSFIFGKAEECTYTDGEEESDQSILKNFMEWAMEMKDILAERGEDDEVLALFPSSNTDTIRFGKNVESNSAVFGSNIGLAKNGALTAGKYNYNNAHSGIVGGSWNIVTGFQHLVAGNFNKVMGDDIADSVCNAIAGACNYVRQTSMSTVNGHWNAVSFADNVIVNGDSLVLEGTSNTEREDGKFVSGTYNNPKTNTLVEIGNGSADARSNAFEVLKDGRAVIAKAPEDSMDIANKGYVDNAVATAIGDIETTLDNIIAIQNELIGGESE